MKKTRTDKAIKEAIKAEMSPLLIGIRNDLKTLAEIVEKSNGEIKFAMSEDKSGIIPVIKGIDGKKGDPGKDAIVDYEKVLKEIKKLLPPGRRGRPGKTPVKGIDYRDGQDGYTPRKGIDYKDGQDGKTIIREKTLTTDEIIEMINGEILPHMIRGLDDYIKKYATSSIVPWSPAGNASGGGGSTIVQTVTFLTETPTGLINGSNKSYTTTRNIGTIVGFAINGQAIHPNEYSTATNTITFVTALDSSLAGTGFTIVYIPA